MRSTPALPASSSTCLRSSSSTRPLSASCSRRALADPEVEVYVAEIDGEPAGSVSVGHGFLRTLYVRPEHQRTGIGSSLHDHALERLRALGADEAKLWTLEENHDARRFYE